jgi:hypothetical protein
MRPTSFDPSALRQHLRRNKIADLPELKRVLGTDTDLTVFRKLKQLQYLASSSGWTPLGRASDGRFWLRRFRAKLDSTAFGAHRAFTHALPSSFGLRSIPSPVSPCFSSLPLWWKKKQADTGRKMGWEGASGAVVERWLGGFPMAKNGTLAKIQELQPSFHTTTEQITIGIDLGDRFSHCCVLGPDGKILTEGRLRSTPETMARHFKDLPPSCICKFRVLKTGKRFRVVLKYRTGLYLKTGVAILLTN